MISGSVVGSALVSSVILASVLMGILELPELHRLNRVVLGQRAHNLSVLNVSEMDVNTLHADTIVAHHLKINATKAIAVDSNHVYVRPSGSRRDAYGREQKRRAQVCAGDSCMESTETGGVWRVYGYGVMEASSKRTRVNSALHVQGDATFSSGLEVFPHPGRETVHEDSGEVYHLSPAVRAHGAVIDVDGVIAASDLLYYEDRKERLVRSVRSDFKNLTQWATQLASKVRQMDPFDKLKEEIEEASSTLNNKVQSAESQAHRQLSSEADASVRSLKEVQTSVSNEVSSLRKEVAHEEARVSSLLSQVSGDDSTVLDVQRAISYILGNATRVQKDFQELRTYIDKSGVLHLRSARVEGSLVVNGTNIQDFVRRADKLLHSDQNKFMSLAKEATKANQEFHSLSGEFESNLNRTRQARDACEESSKDVEGLRARLHERESNITEKVSTLEHILRRFRNFANDTAVFRAESETLIDTARHLVRAFEGASNGNELIFSHIQAAEVVAEDIDLDGVGSISDAITRLHHLVTDTNGTLRDVENKQHSQQEEFQNLNRRMTEAYQNQSTLGARLSELQARIQLENETMVELGNVESEINATVRGVSEVVRRVNESYLGGGRARFSNLSVSGAVFIGGANVTHLYEETGAKCEAAARKAKQEEGRLQRAEGRLAEQEQATQNLTALAKVVDTCEHKFERDFISNKTAEALEAAAAVFRDLKKDKGFGVGDDGVPTLNSARLRELEAGRVTVKGGTTLEGEAKVEGTMEVKGSLKIDEGTTFLDQKGAFVLGGKDMELHGAHHLPYSVYDRVYAPEKKKYPSLKSYDVVATRRVYGSVSLLTSDEFAVVYTRESEAGSASSVGTPSRRPSDSFGRPRRSFPASGNSYDKDASAFT